MLKPARIFNANYLERNVSYQYDKQLTDKFVATGSLLNKKREVNRSILNEAVEVAILGHLQMDNNQWIKAVSQASGVPSTSVLRILKKHKFHPYKLKLVQELHEMILIVILDRF